jgi:LysM repeat protein
VRRGDSLASIAKRTGVPQRQLMALNSLDNPNRIYPGQRLRLRAVEGG